MTGASNASRSSITAFELALFPSAVYLPFLPVIIILLFVELAIPTHEDLITIRTGSSARAVRAASEDARKNIIISRNFIMRAVYAKCGNSRD
jgi:hypothetical protein